MTYGSANISRKLMASTVAPLRTTAVLQCAYLAVAGAGAPTQSAVTNVALLASDVSRHVRRSGYAANREPGNQE